MTKKILFLLFIISLFIAPLSTNALTPLPNPNQTQINELLRQITLLQEQLRQLQANQTYQKFCYNFDKNLGVGKSDNDVDKLRKALFLEGFLTEEGFDKMDLGEQRNTPHLSFDQRTVQEVSKFQEKYAYEILTPNGLIAPTGYVGPATRKVLNRLYGCRPQTVFITPNVLPNSTISGGNYYSQPLFVHGFSSTQNITWSVVSGSLPPGLTLSSNIYACIPEGPCPPPDLTKASIIGWATEIDNDIVGPLFFHFTIQARNGTQIAQQTYTLTVLGVTSVNQPPVISGVSGPTTLRVGETGTWTVQASDPENGTLSYSVIWGDEPVVPQVARAPAPPKEGPQPPPKNKKNTKTPTST